MPTLTDRSNAAQDPNALIPDPTSSEEQYRRFWHQDISELPADRVWAEKTLLTLALAEQTFARVRPRVVWSSSTRQVTHLEWMRDRLTRLKGLSVAA